MKKTIIASAVSGLLVSGMLLYSCQKEHVPVVTNAASTPGEYHVSIVSASNNLLAFNTTSDYQAIADNPSVKAKSKFENYVSSMGNFTSLSKLKNNERSNSDYDDIDNTFLRRILNKDAAVQIGDYIYKISVKKEKVFVIHKSDMKDYKDAVRGNVKNKKVMVFSIGDDVLSLTGNADALKDSSNGGNKLSNVPPIGPGTGGNSGGGVPCYSCSVSTNKINELDTLYTTVAGNRELDTKVKYERYGVYFTLYAHMRLPTGADNSLTELVLEANGTYGVHNSYHQSYFNAGNPYSNHNFIAELKYDAYHGSHRLAFFDINARYSVWIHTQNGIIQYPYTSWREIRINM